MTNLVEGIQQEMARVRDELLPAYEAIGAAGQFGLIVLKQAVEAGEKAIAGGDAIQMLNAYNILKGCA